MNLLSKATVVLLNMTMTVPRFEIIGLVSVIYYSSHKPEECRTHIGLSQLRVAARRSREVLFFCNTLPRLTPSVTSPTDDATS